MSLSFAQLLSRTSDVKYTDIDEISAFRNVFDLAQTATFEDVFGTSFETAATEGLTTTRSQRMKVYGATSSFPYTSLDGDQIKASILNLLSNGGEDLPEANRDY